MLATVPVDSERENGTNKYRAPYGDHDEKQSDKSDFGSLKLLVGDTALVGWVEVVARSCCGQSLSSALLPAIFGTHYCFFLRQCLSSVTTDLAFFQQNP